MTSENNTAIELTNISETYQLEIKTESQTIRENFKALQDVSFSVNKGEAVAIIGPNGAGKSTLLRILAGLLKPEKGQVRIHGRVSSLLDLGAGFHSELTGRDNLLLNASLYDFSREELNSKLEQILRFADIGKFIDVPVRCYSQGMYVRLAFSLAIHVDPDILLIDDCLAVGDDGFRIKCIDKVLEFKSKNKTIIFVTHDFGTARQVCTRGLYLRQGNIFQDGPLDEIVQAYLLPLDVDKSSYKYLGAKIVADDVRERAAAADRQHDEENRRRLDQEIWLKAQEERNILEQTAWHKEQAERIRHEQDEWRLGQEQRNSLELQERIRYEQDIWCKAQAERIRYEQDSWCKAQEERIRYEQDIWRKAQESRTNCNKARRSGPVELLDAQGFRVVVASPQNLGVQIFSNDNLLTDDDGVRTLFNKGRFKDVSSSAASWRIIKVSKTFILCFLRWPKPVHVTQIWRWVLMSDGNIDFRVETRSLDEQPVDSLRTECRLRSKPGIIKNPLFCGKEKSFFMGMNNDVLFISSQDNQITDSYAHTEGKITLYFLTVSDRKMLYPQPVIKHHYSLKVMSEQVRDESSSILPHNIVVAHTLTNMKLNLHFSEGQCCLRHTPNVLTTGMGLYTSLYADGIWYDSTQALWSVISAGVDRLVVVGRWPWLPVSQIWDIQLVSDTKIRLDLSMQVLKAFPLKVYETALMLDPVYRHWSAGEAVHVFPKDVTLDDFFRICLSSRAADGHNGLLLRGDAMPALAFIPDLLPQQRIMLENAAHLNGAESRLLHCSRVHKQEDSFVEAGEYNFFKGFINIGGEI